MAKEKIKRKGYNRMTGERGLKGASKKAAERKSQTTAMMQKNFELAGKPKPKFSKEFKKRAKAEAAKKLVKRTGKTILKRIGPIATVLTAAEIAKGAYKGAKKVGASLKAKKACEGKGNVYRKGFCISSKTIKSKSLRTVKK